MHSIDREDDAISVQFRQEFIESVRDQVDDIEAMIDGLVGNQSNDNEGLFAIQRHVHNIKGQGKTFGFPLTGRVAHMLEDYLLSAGGIGVKSVADIRLYLNLIMDLIATGESIAQNDPQGLLKALPTGQTVTFSTQRAHDINVLLVMPAGLQRKMVANELLSCGFRVIRAYDSIEALSIALDITPDIVFVNYDMTPFNGSELSNVFAAVEKLRDIHFVLLTSYQVGDGNLKSLPENISVVQKNVNFMEDIGELLIQWGVFGNIPDKPTVTGKAISMDPKAIPAVKYITQRPLNILLAEDNPINQQLIKATLEAFCHRLEIAENGLLAVKAHIEGNYDLILMDVRMPEMDGGDAARAIRKLPGEKAGIPIIAVTADAMAEQKKEYFEAGMDECVGKPINRAELFEAINKVMNEEIHLQVDVETPESEQQIAPKPSDKDQDDTVDDFLKQLQNVADRFD